MKHSLYLQDLKEEVQLDVFETVRSILLASGEISPQGEHETWGEYEKRVFEEVDAFLNLHNILDLHL